MLRSRKSGRPWRTGRWALALTCGFLSLVPAVHAQQTPAPRRLAGAEAEVPARLQAKVNDLIDEISESEVEMDVMLRRSKLLRTKFDIVRAAVADPAVIEIVAFGSREIEIIGKQTGSTTLTLWLGNAQQTRLLSMLITVGSDAGVDDRRRLEYGELQKMMNELFPDSKIVLIPIADKLIVKGEARDNEEATRIMTVLRRGGGNVGALGTNGQAQASDPFPDTIGPGSLPQANIISLLEVPGEHQVMLKVRIAELKRSAIRRLGTRFNFTATDFAFSSLLGGAPTVFASATFNDNSFNLFVEALAQNGSAKILAEPNLVTLSGKVATFRAGGEFAVPTAVGVGGVSAVSTAFHGFGTFLQFTPTVLDKDRIRLNVNPTFSTINRNNTVNGIFGTDLRTVNTTVDMREGQTFALAGLIQEEQRGDRTRVPFIGDLPAIGVLFSRNDISRDETELVILVTPELVHPMEPEDVPSLVPGLDVTEPDDFEFYIMQRIEGIDPNVHHRSTVWPMHQDRIKHSRRKQRVSSSVEGYYVSGSHGYSN